jgi:uncharacterized protein (TIGR00251 family)
VTLPDGLVRASGRGCLVRIRAAPGAKETGRIGLHGESLKVTVHAPPERGKANDELLRWLAESLGVAKKEIALKSGDTSRDKVFSIASLSAAEVAAAIERMIGASS